MSNDPNAISPLRRRMIEDMTIRRFTEKTQGDYIRHVRAFAAFLGRSPEVAEPEDLRRFQRHMAASGARAATMNAAVSALRFFFQITLGRAGFGACLAATRSPERLPVVLSTDEVARLLGCAPGLKYQAALSVAYGCGLRVSEIIHLKVADIDSARMLIRVEQGKGRKDRYVMLSPDLLDILRAWWKVKRPRGWLFPGQQPSDPLTARQLNRVVHAAAHGGRAHQARVDAHAPAQLRHPPARAQDRHPRHPGAARPSQARHHGALHPRGPEHDPGGGKPAHPFAAQNGAAGLKGPAAMARPALEIADILNRHGDAYLRRHRWASEPRPAQGDLGHPHLPHRGARRPRRALRRLHPHGGQLQLLPQPALPQVPGRGRPRWLAAREADLLPVPYFHVVFTLPASIAAIAFTNKAAVYDLLFKAAAETVTTAAADPKHLGARVGLTAVLHTWGSALTHHPHVHMIVPGGGLSPDGTRWIACRPGFFLPVRVLSRLFRRLFLDGLWPCMRPAASPSSGRLVGLADRDAFSAHLAPLRKAEWVVYAKRPFGGPEAVLAYLSRYTHRVAISNSRLIRSDEDGVTFRWKDYRARGKTEGQGWIKTMTLKADEFIRRFLIHVLPSGFHRIRHYGLLASGARAAAIARARELLAVTRPPDRPDGTGEDRSEEPSRELRPCPCCGGRMLVIETFERGCAPRSRLPSAFTVDSS